MSGDYSGLKPRSVTGSAFKQYNILLSEWLFLVLHKIYKYFRVGDGGQ